MPRPSALHAVVAGLGVAFAIAIALGGAPVVAHAQAAAPWAELGRAPTPAELQAWDIDVRGDFKGLPAGSGSVADGMVIWEAQCASCHGIFGESNQFFTPIVGGTTAADMERGRVAALADGSEPQRTTLMRLSRLSALWDYTRRAMPWTEPKSLSADEVYAVVAYILNLGGIVDDDFVLSDRNIGEVQARLPNRDGETFYRPMWDVAGKPDVHGDACMRDCATSMEVHSMLPSFARDAHGNLALQNRTVGPVRGADTTRDAPRTLEEARAIASAASGEGAAAGMAATGATGADAADGQAPARLVQEQGCLACHARDQALVGPAFRTIAAKYDGSPDAAARLERSIREGSQGTWGTVPMPPNAGVADAEARAIVKWILGGAP